MINPIVVVGAGGFGREAVDVIEAINLHATGQGAEATWSLLGVVDDALSTVNAQRLADRSVPYLGTTEEFLAAVDPATSYVVGIGAPQVRRRVATAYESAGLAAAVLVHPAATIGAQTTLGAGTVVCAGARITTNITLGRHVHVNPNATIGHDTTLGDFVSMNPASSVSGDCVIEDEVLVGVGGIVLNALRVGRGSIVGGAACVVRDVEPGSTMVGVPAKAR